MNNLEVHTLENAPEKSQPFLNDSVSAFGFIPNLHGVMAAAPNVLKGYQSLHSLFMDSSFNADELTVIWQTINVEHDCHYCVPAHSMIAHSMKIDEDLVSALRNSTAMPNEKLQVLHDTTLKMVRQRGKLTNEEVNAFYAAGYKQQQLLEIVLGLSQKIMSNYINHIADTPLDEVMQPFA